ncbi:MAG: hypothetical protein IJA09_08010, partial [Bacteroidales bacterium]|nr:hypothetical protein [Bacteroidales bacterium]
MKKGTIYLLLTIMLTMMSCTSMKVVEYNIKKSPNIALSDTTPIVLLYNVSKISVQENQTVLQIQDSVAQYIFA